MRSWLQQVFKKQTQERLEKAGVELPVNDAPKIEGEKEKKAFEDDLVREARNKWLQDVHTQDLLRELTKRNFDLTREASVLSLRCEQLSETNQVIARKLAQASTLTETLNYIENGNASKN